MTVGQDYFAVLTPNKQIIDSSRSLGTALRNLSGDKGKILVVDDEASRKPNFTDAFRKFVMVKGVYQFFVKKLLT
ncbi:hypothetical protein H6G91_31270 [Nostoc muscorum FACHB-395]|jgi:hypothetical protein|uniref:hypothetical protein n=1 Tax=Nostoc sp. C057 TaxID=2576903 RepID=UPI0015C39069|nr:hypothetical protein [Nostoc sp. C057]MBD2511672.1 hypothetical protein [Desmonostoc muscorum FACHB-395]QLE53340.1 hypothetical protein FD724_36150 [Nostoc sp. C057]